MLWSVFIAALIGLSIGMPLFDPENRAEQSISRRSDISKGDDALHAQMTIKDDETATIAKGVASTGDKVETWVRTPSEAFDQAVRLAERDSATYFFRGNREQRLAFATEIHELMNEPGMTSTHEFAFKTVDSPTPEQGDVKILHFIVRPVAIDYRRLTSTGTSKSHGGKE